MGVEEQVPRQHPAQDERKPRERTPASPERRKVSAARAAKYQKLTDAASPSSPSVRLTQLVVATKAKAASGTIQTPTSADPPSSGRCSSVSPAV